LIESKLAAGIRHEDILAALNEHGFSMSLAAYKTTLYRLRKQAAKTSDTKALPASPGYLVTEQGAQRASGKNPTPYDDSKPVSTESPDIAGKSSIQQMMEKPVPKASYKDLVKKGQS